MINKKPIRYLTPILSAALACADSPNGPIVPQPVATVQLSTELVTLERGDTFAIIATARAADGTVLTGQTITWQTSDPTIADVGEKGRVTAAGLGRARITATADVRSADAVIEVMPSNATDLAGRWWLRSFDGIAVPGTYAVFLDQEVDGRIVDRVEFRLDSAVVRQLEGPYYHRRYCFSELHDGTLAFRHCWGDHGRTVVGTGNDRGRISLLSEYIQNLSAHGQFHADVTMSLIEPLWLGEAHRRTVWVRQ